eukprot:CAMPEP_0115864822 /NCGR_PEP_ID=MMETSP0287-20121206/19400_1 /TAXON_ID=412157 /ORGANISM="Chrysochromulina rotalis, Strain UIO044" /LENGTH=36 /DNA_ID= /DNA_START= /DNA_END= /DNA_ORIENTATION=
MRNGVLESPKSSESSGHAPSLSPYAAAKKAVRTERI